MRREMEGCLVGNLGQKTTPFRTVAHQTNILPIQIGQRISAAAERLANDGDSFGVKSHKAGAGRVDTGGMSSEQHDPSGYRTLQRVLGEDDMDAFRKRWEAFVLGLRFG